MKKIIIISGPSGVGKSTYIKKIIDKTKNINFIIPFTTRSKRETENNNHDYYFIDEISFARSYKNKSILDWDYTLNNYYGFFKSEFENTSEISITHALAKMALRMKYSQPDKYITIFIEPSDSDTDNIKLRIRDRNVEDDELTMRINHGKDELIHKNLFDHVLKSNNPDILVNSIISIINIS